jgi:hypothetical protein
LMGLPFSRWEIFKLWVSPGGKLLNMHLNESTIPSSGLLRTLVGKEAAVSRRKFRRMWLSKSSPLLLSNHHKYYISKFIHWHVLLHL